MRRKLCIIALSVAALLAGCSTDVPNLSKVDNNLAAQYVADALLRNDKHYDESLDYDHSILEPTPTPAPTAVPTPEPASSSAPGTEGVGGQDNQSEPTVTNVTLSQIYGISGVGIEQTTYQVKNSYGSGKFAVVTPREGKKLAVVYFTISNNTGKAKRVNLANADVSAQLYLNGESVGGSLNSIAEGDLKYFDEKIGAGKKKQGVLLFEIDKSAKPSTLEVRFGKGNSQAAVKVH